jgi:hypothetical protein
MCSQDQWDIYKLDPFYECRVYPPPQLSTITTSISSPDPNVDPPGSKRTVESTPSEESISSRPHKRRVETHDTSDSEEEVDRMMVDGDSFYGSVPTPARKRTDWNTRRQERAKSRQERWQKTRIRTDNLGPQSQPQFDFSDAARESQSLPPDPKRKGMS